MRVFYLHGFASSAQSSKAAFLASKLAPLGIGLETPDFNEPDFSTLTVSRMVTQACARVDAAPGGAVLVGSSLGAFVAVAAALARPSRIRQLVLLAPALDFGGNRMRRLGDRGLDDWKRTDRLEVFHYGFGRTMSVHYELYSDARRHDALHAPLSMPIQVFQGTRDDAVDPAMVRDWCRARPTNVELHLLDDDHQLTASLDYIGREMFRFIGIRP
jgi:pimeloyl-ACP methyl ester carboxylesterase